MTINDIMKEKGLSRYSLSKKSGIDWSTISDLYSGKVSIAKCSYITLRKLSIGLDMSLEDVEKLEDGKESIEIDGKPQGKNYLEHNLSQHLAKAIHEYVEGEKNNVSYLDCLWGEVYGSINADLWAGVISEEQANYLRKKYL